MANLLRKGNRTEPASPPPVTRAPAPKQPVGASPSKKIDEDGINPWDLAQIWIESVSKEESARKQWEKMYGFMADYDAKGNLKPKKRTPENATRFSETIPNSRGHDYGWRLQSEIGQEIQNLQHRFDDQHRKRVPTAGLGYD